MARSVEKYVIYNLREIYHEHGEYEFKVVLSPKYFKNSHLSEVTMVDSDRKPMKYSVKKWGRKINCVFTIDQDVSDGVSQVCLSLKNDRDQLVQGWLRFWVIK